MRTETSGPTGPEPPPPPRSAPPAQRGARSTSGAPATGGLPAGPGPSTVPEYGEPAPEVRPLRWIGALAFFGVVSAALAVLAWEAITDSFTWIGDGRSQSDAVILATEAPPADAGAAVPEGDAGAADSPDGQAASGDDPGGDDPGDDGGGDQAVPTTYEVQPGDTGSSIAQDLFGDQSAWDEIATFNGLSPDVTLDVGQVLRIPDR